MTFEQRIATQQEAAETALSAVSRDVLEYRSLSDEVLLARFRVDAQLRKLGDANTAVMAGEIARRSAVALGGAGLAQKRGFRTAVELVKATSGMAGRDAAATVRVGTMAQDAADAAIETADPTTGELVDAQPWLREVSSALHDGSISIASADAIRTGLGQPCDGVSIEELASIVGLLITDAGQLDSDRLAKEARYLRDQLDEAGISDRERARHNARSLRFFRQADGMGRLIWTMDPETAASIGTVFDRITSPKRGGPRFIDAPDPATGVTGPDSLIARSITEDLRSTEQLASDVFAALVVGGATMDTSQMLGDSGPVIRMLVLQTELDRGPSSGNRTFDASDAFPGRAPSARSSNDHSPTDRAPGDRTSGDRPPADRTPDDRPPDDRAPGDRTPGDRPPADRTPDDRPPDDRLPDDRPPSDRLLAGKSSSNLALHGHGYIEGEPDPVSINTIERAICTGTVQPILFDQTGRAIDIAPDRRLFSRKQRIALAVTFGGCVFPGCERPPSWTEAHHINHVVRDQGKTITADGVLLCKHHHLLVHNNGWEIVRSACTYRLIPPSSIDPDKTPILIMRRSAAFNDLLREPGSRPASEG